MEIWKTIKAAFGRGTSTPPDARRLNAVDELALSASLGALADEETIKAALIGLVLSLGPTDFSELLCCLRNRASPSATECRGDA